MFPTPAPWFVLCSPLRGHRFIGTRSPISFETLSKELFEPGLFCCRPKLLKVDLRFSAVSRSILTKKVWHSHRHFFKLPHAAATCAFAIQTSRCLRYMVTPKMVPATPNMAKRVSRNQNSNFTCFLSYLGTPKMVLSHIKYGTAGCDRDITPRLGVCDRDITTLSAHTLIGHCLGNSHVTCQKQYSCSPVTAAYGMVRAEQNALLNRSVLLDGRKHKTVVFSQSNSLRE